MDSIYRTLRFFAWLGIIYGALATSAFAITAWQDMRFILVIVRSGVPLRAFGILIYIVSDAASILLLIGCAGLLRNKAHSGAICMSWAICVIGLRLASELNGLSSAFTSPVLVNWPWAVQRVVDWMIQCEFPLVTICILSLPQTAAALATPRGFEVLVGDSPRRENQHLHTAEIAPPVEDTIQSASGWAGDVVRRLAWAGTVVGAAAVIGDIVAMLWTYYGVFFHSVPDTWRGTVIISLDRASRISFWVLLFGSVLVLARQKIGNLILLVWAAGFIVLTIGTLAVYGLPYVWWQAMQSSLGGRYDVLSNTVDQLLDSLQLSAMAIIAAYLLLQLRWDQNS